MRGARGDRSLGGGVVLGGGDGLHGLPVAVGEVEHAGGDPRPGLHRAGAREVVGAVLGGGAGLHVAVAVAEQVQDALRHLVGEGEAAELVVDDGYAVEGVGRVGDAVGEGFHRLDEVAAVADDPGAADDVAARAAGHGQVAGGLGLAVDGQRAEGLGLGVVADGAVEDVVGGHVHQGDAVLGAGTGHEGGAGRVRGPAGPAAPGRLGGVDGGVGAAVDDGAVEGPVVLVVVPRLGEVELVDVAVVEAGQAPRLGGGAHGAAELAVAARDERAPRRHGQGVRERGVGLVGLGELAPVERDGPLDAQIGVGEVHEGVGGLQLRRPVGVHQVGVGGAVLEGLVGVAHAAGHVDGAARVELAGVDLAEAPPGAQVDPRAEHAAAGDGDELVPGLRVDAAGHALPVVEGDVVLDRAHVGQAQRAHLLALPVLLEPAAGVTVHGQVEHEHPGDVRARSVQFLLEFERHGGRLSRSDRRGRAPGPPLRARSGAGPRGAAAPAMLLLALGGVPRLGGLLGRAPPGLVVAVPADRLREAGGEVGVRGLPAELAAELGRVDRVAAVVAGAVAHPVEVVLGAAEGLQDLAQDGDVVQLAVGADQVGLADAALREDAPDGGAVVLGVDPVADVPAVAVELGAHPVDQVRDLARDELLHVLVGAVVVGAVGDGGLEAEGAGPGADQQVGGRLGGAVRGARAVGRLLGEAGRVVQRQVAVDLVGGDVVVAHAVPAAGLDEGVGALDVGAQERARVGDGVVVVGLGGVVDHGVGPGHEAVDERGVADVAHDELDAVRGQPRDVVGVAGVGQLVEHGDVDARVLAHDVVDEVGADEAAAAGDDDALGLEGGVGHGASPSSRGSG